MVLAAAKVSPIYYWRGCTLQWQSLELSVTADIDVHRTRNRVHVLLKGETPTSVVRPLQNLPSNSKILSQPFHLHHADVCIEGEWYEGKYGGAWSTQDCALESASYTVVVLGAGMWCAHPFYSPPYQASSQHTLWVDKKEASTPNVQLPYTHSIVF